MTNKKRIALGMSGGVDSSVAVAVLQALDYEVLGVTLVFQCEEGKSAEKDAAVVGARAVCERFGIEHVAVDCSPEFEHCVIEPFAQDYAFGLTPSPCVGCNANVKIPQLIQVADQHDCEYVATGHYARVNQLNDTGRFAVLAALDYRKDQSYMLCQLTQEQLKRLVLPLGGMTKLEVRSIAADLGLEVADTPDSQDICFAPQGYRTLLEQRGISAKPGSIVNLKGQQLGTHTGLIDYTVGQRKGIGIAGPEPYYVIEKRAETNELVIGTQAESRITWARVERMNWQAISAPEKSFEAMIKLRYRSTPCACIIEPTNSHEVLINLHSPQSATAPGQYAVIYQGSTVLGGGVIKEVG